MPLLDRDTIVDRPVLLDRSGNKKQDEDSEQGEEEVQVLGEGGGPTINGMEFEVGSYDIVAAANLASVLATGNDDGQSFKNVFRNAAIQLYELNERGKDITSLSSFAAQNNVDMLGIQPGQAELLQGEVIQEPDRDNDDEVDIKQIEDEINQSEDEESEDEESDDEESGKSKASIQVSKKDGAEEDDEE